MEAQSAVIPMDPKGYKFTLKSSTSGTVIGATIPVIANIEIDGYPLKDAEVQIMDKETGEVLATGKTNAQGFAVLEVMVKKPRLEITGKAIVAENR